MKRPDYTDSLKFPDDITKLTSQQLGQLLGQYTGVMGYALSESAKASVEVLRIESDIFHKHAPVRSRHAVNNISQWQAKAMLDMSTLDETARLTVAKAHRELIAAHVAILDRYISTLSREMTRRGFERT